MNPNEEEIMEIGKCKINVNADGDVTIKCDGEPVITLGAQQLKMLDGISDLVTQSDNTDTGEEQND